MTPIKSKPPIRCTPCRVNYGPDRLRYQIESDGTVRLIPSFGERLMSAQEVRANLDVIAPEPEALAKRIRQEASRLRRNRNARERNQAMRDLGMVKTPFGWE